MSTINQVIEEASNLTDTVANQCQLIDDKLKDLDQLYQKMLQREKEAWSPYWRLSRNQIGSVTNGLLDYFSVIEDCEVEFEIIRKIKTDILWENRDKEEQMLLLAMGKDGMRYTLPEFNVIRMTWCRKPSKGNGRTFHQFLKYHTWVTHACYAKLINGNCQGSYFEGVTNEWSLCGQAVEFVKTSYTTPHPIALSEKGEIHFCLLGSVAGRLPIDKNNPKWGYFPYVLTSED